MSKHLPPSYQRNLSAHSPDFGGFLIHSFIVWRIASLLTFRMSDGSKRVEQGPYKVFDKWRKLLNMQFDEYGYPLDRLQTNEIAKIFACMYCSTIWVGFAVALLTGHGLAYGLALSTAAILVEDAEKNLA